MSELPDDAQGVDYIVPATVSEDCAYS